jgi:hypothetical protein
LLLALVAASIVAGAVLAGPAAAQPAPSPPVVIDGPNAAIASLNGLSVARDGTGGLVYLEAFGGVPHVVVSGLSGGEFQPTQAVDSGLAGPASQPVIAAGNGGVLLIAFINAGTLYVVQRSSATASFTAPQPLAIDASNPSIQMSNLGKAYVAFTVADGAGHDVRTAYWAGGAWTLEAPPLNAAAVADDAGTGTGAPALATAGDGVAIVAWGEEGHVYSRRVWGIAPSVVSEQADVPSVSGCGEVSAGDAAVAAGADSSYADVAFQEVLSCGATQTTRVLMNRLRGSQYDGAVAADGGVAGAGDPNVAMTEYGQGFVTSEGSNNVIGLELGNNGAASGVFQINTFGNHSQPNPVPAIAGLFSDLIAWQQDPGSGGPAENRVRYEPRASTLGPEMVLSSPASGATDAARGLVVSGDVAGDAAVAWVQGTGASTEIVAERLYQPPATATPPKTTAYTRSAEPALSWTPSGSRWGPIVYTVTLDGVQIVQTGATVIRVGAPLHDGPHSWRVTASNPAGESSTSRTATVFVDTVAPRISATVNGARHPGASLTLRMFYRDAPPAGLPARDASGVAGLLTIRWGDGTVTRVKPGTHTLIHTYRKTGRYRITIVIADKAGNQRTLVRRLQIKKPPPPSHKPGGKHK